MGGFFRFSWSDLQMLGDPNHTDASQIKSELFFEMAEDFGRWRLRQYSRLEPDGVPWHVALK
jgi:hypothetical protein